MSPHSSFQYVLIIYLLWWGTRIRGCFRRWQQPLLRGPEWFFNVRVQPDFYTGTGRKILHRYWMRMFIPFVLDIPVALAAFLQGHLQAMFWLIAVQAGLIHLNHVYSVDMAERQARRFAMPEAEQPVAAVAFSLQPRRLRDYTNPKVEWALALASVVALLWPAVGTVRHRALRPWQRALIMLGIADAPTPTVHLQGDPGIQVWIDSHTALYYCPGEEQYGKTADGRFSTQRDAQMESFEPASRSACE